MHRLHWRKKSGYIWKFVQIFGLTNYLLFTSLAFVFANEPTKELSNLSENQYRNHSDYEFLTKYFHALT